jgi:hypothetical protein
VKSEDWRVESEVESGEFRIESEEWRVKGES